MISSLEGCSFLGYKTEQSDRCVLTFQRILQFSLPRQMTTNDEGSFLLKSQYTSTRPFSITSQTVIGTVLSISHITILFPPLLCSTLSCKIIQYIHQTFQTDKLKDTELNDSSSDNTCYTTGSLWLVYFLEHTITNCSNIHTVFFKLHNSTWSLAYHISSATWQAIQIASNMTQDNEHSHTCTRRAKFQAIRLETS